MNHMGNDDLTYTEVADKAALDLIEVYQDPAEIERLYNEQLISEEINDKNRDDAKKMLKQEGKIPQDYE